MSRAIVVVLVACAVTGCQRGNAKQQAQCVRKAVVTQQAFYATSGAKLQKQYERAKREFPELARYVALQEVSLGVLATGYETHIRDLCTARLWHLSAAGKSFWQARCDHKVHMPSDDCIFKCLDCIGELSPDDCAAFCNCGGEPDD